MLVDMIEDLLEVFDKDPEFRSYTLDGQMAAVLDFLEIRPAHATRIRELVESKKLFVGPWYILSDEFLSSGESHIRNLLFGFRYGKQLGGVMPVGYIPDQFGHIAQMPQILRGFGIDTAMIYRGFGGEPGQEKSEYWWFSPDESRVLLHHLPKDGYSAGYFATKAEETILQKFNRLKKELDSRATTSQRLFFNGGDHHWPDDTVTAAIDVLRKHSDAGIIHSNFVDYFDSLKKELNGQNSLPRLEGETRFGYRHAFAVLGGVFSSRMYLKQMNAACEVMLERHLEPLNVIASLAGMRSKTALIDQAWKYVLQNQDHDAICGTSVDEVHQEMVTRYNKAKQIGDHVKAECLAQLLPYDERCHEDDRYLFVFNPSPFHRTAVVEDTVDFFLQDVVVGLNPEVNVETKRPPTKTFKLVDVKGNEVPVQILKREEAFGVTYSKHDYPHQTLVDRYSILLLAEDIPPVGWKGFRIIKESASSSYESDLKTGERCIENEFLKVEANSDGSVRLTDKKSGVVFERMNFFEDSGDVGDEYTYSYPEKDEWFYSHQFPPSVCVVENGPLRAALRIEHTMLVPQSAAAGERSRSPQKAELKITTTLYLETHSRRIDVKTRVRNDVKDHRLRALFATDINSEKSLAETPFAVVERHHQSYEVSQFPYEHPALIAPMQRFVTIHDDRKGFTLIVKGLPEYELKLDQRGVLALTLLRCVGKLSGRNLITRPGGAAGWWNETPEAQCLGVHTLEYALFPHSGDQQEFWPGVLKEVERFIVPTLTAKRKNEQTLMERSFIIVEPAHLQLTALKEAEDGNGFIVRVCNPINIGIEGRMHLERPIKNAFRVKLNEEIIEPIPVDSINNLHISVPPYAIISLKLET